MLMKVKYEERRYRSLINNDNLIHYQVKIGESDLFIGSDQNLYEPAFQSLLRYRNSIENYILRVPIFRTTLLPLPEDPLAPAIVRKMLACAKICGVGPMAAVAGAVAEFVGSDLMELSSNIVIENGGDIFLKTINNSIVSIFAGESPLSYHTKLLIKSSKTPIGICTSSATVGPSLSFGIADAVCVISHSPTLADAAASAIGNRVKKKDDINRALEFGKSLSGVLGLIIIVGDKMGVTGDVEFI